MASRLRGALKPVTWLDKRGIKAAVRQASVPALEAVALSVKSVAQISMRGGGKEGRPSPTGQPPNVQTNVLRASIAVARTFKFSFLIGPTGQAEYGRVHEFGTGKRRRPFMRPALTKVRKSGVYKAEFGKIRLLSTPAGKRTNNRNKRRPI